MGSTSVSKHALYRTARVRSDLNKIWVPAGFVPGEVVAVRYWKHAFDVTTKREQPVYFISKTADFQRHVEEGTFATVFEAALQDFVL